MLLRKTDVLTTCASELPAAVRMADEVLQNAFRLRGDVAADELLGGGINGDLAGDEDEAVGFDGLRVGSDSFGSVVGGDDLAHFAKVPPGTRLIRFAFALRFSQKR